MADAVGDEEGRAGAGIEAGPVAVHERAESDAIAQHELAAVRVAGDCEENPRGGGSVEGVRVVGQEDRDGARGDLASGRC